MSAPKTAWRLCGVRVAHKGAVQTVALARATSSMKAVLSPPAVSRPRNSMVWAGGHGERGGGVGRVRVASGLEGAHDVAVDQHLEVLREVPLLPRWAASKESM